MIHHHFNKACYLLAAVFLLAGCSRNDTRYFSDAEQPGLAIFSSTGNNLFSCFIDGKPWRSVSRTTGGFEFPVTRYEVDISKQSTGATTDTLLISWQGYFGTKDTLRNTITLHLAVAAGFGYKELNALQGQRLLVDGTNGYFSSRPEFFGGPDLKGPGHIYFHALKIDSTGPGSYTGAMNGLLDADFASSKITNGRFDHVMEAPQVNL
jgi:hypothetical protein